MTTIEQLKHLHAYGYRSGNILTWLPDRRRRHEERLIRGSYRRFFMRAVRPHLKTSSTVLELGPGRGSWTRALLRYIPDGQVHTLDFLDVAPWLRPEKYQGRLVCHQVTNGSFDCVADESFDFFFSFGVLCHNTTSAIRDLMANALPKMKPRATAIHEYGDWQKLNRLGWQDNCGVPAFFRELPDDDERNWWPRNDPETMSGVCREAGWVVDQADLGVFERDSVIQLRAPAP